MNFKNALAGVAVRDFEAAVEWYQNLIGLPPDTRPMAHVAGWQFKEGGWLQVFQEDERAGQGTVIFAVVSLESQLEELAKREISVERMQSPDFGEVGIIYDPDGNRVVFAGPLTGVLDD